MKVKIYFDPRLLDLGQREACFELIKSKDRNDRKESPMDKKIQSVIDWVDAPERADLLLVPMSINYYFDQGLKGIFFQKLKKLTEFNKPVWTFTTGDHGISISKHENVTVYRTNGYSSQLREFEKVLPVFITDPIQQFYSSDENQLWQDQDKNNKSIIGFCGNAPRDLYRIAREYWAFTRHRLKGVLNLHPYDVHPFQSTSLLRNRVLDLFEQRNEFQTNYIKRNEYRAGAKSPEQRKMTSLEYFKNMLESDFIPCVRGAGNFSVRFYETLAMGRIPIFIDTDSPLPQIREVNWSEHLVHISMENLKRAPKLVLDWIQEHDLLKVKQKNRSLWKEKLTIDGYWIEQLQQFIR